MDVYNPKGERLFTTTYDRIQYAGYGHFVAMRKEKKGLIGSNGKLVLPLEYDAIGTGNNNMISLLKSMRFGFYDVKHKRLVKPEYEKNILRYNEDIFAAFKNGSYSLINSKNKVVGKIPLEEIRHWTDSVALIKSGGAWMLLNVYTQERELTDISNFTMIRDTPGDKLMIVQSSGQVGVLSEAKGFVIPVKFSDIINVGSADHPLYFTEKHVAEASIFVVIYYDENGVMLRKEVYEQDDYDRIYCNQ
jgi:hypothetical protein